MTNEQLLRLEALREARIFADNHCDNEGNSPTISDVIANAEIINTFLRKAD